MASSLAKPILMMMSYKRIDRYVGWGMFIVATTVYTLTVEPTLSLWDCGEFIASAYKLQVPHPPGAPFFLLLGRMFAMLAGDQLNMVAWCINMVSVISSGATIMLLYWTITLLGRKVLRLQPGGESLAMQIWLIGSGVVGALAYTFSDSFWFSATEAEVYGLSSFFTAFVFWAMLYWEYMEGQVAHRWLILIAYMMGLSIGVHLLNLVTIPALALIYYFRTYPQVKTTGILLAFIGGVLLIGVVMIGIIPGLPSLASWFEVFFVNSLGLPFNSGFVFFVVTILGGLIFGFYHSIKNQKALLNTCLLALTFVLIGYSSYTMIPIRSAYDPPIDQNNPENIVSLVSYLNREQYGSRPLLYGPYFTARLIDQQQGAPVYEKGKHQYIVTNHKMENTYDPAETTAFPRMYSSVENHEQLYRQWLGLQPHEKPGFGDNLSYFFRYQLGHMYLRYLMWNYVGRSSDIKDADWLMPWDSTDDLPEKLANNKARNNFYLLPLILGLLGFFYQYKQDVKGFGVVGALFLLTGVALVVYLNAPPVEPRERDYIYVGSYYAFAIWIGLGVLALAQALSKLLKGHMQSGVVASAICLSVPGIMAFQGWDDHDRTGRYFALDMAKNVLASCAPNAILFTGGDNDTFPLWYAQEVEQFRTDVRVIVLSYANTDWYIGQMRRQAYESAPLPFTLTEENYKQGGPNDYLPFVERPNIKGAISLKQYLKLIQKGSNALLYPGGRYRYNTVPSQDFYLDVELPSSEEQPSLPDMTTGTSAIPSVPALLQEVIPRNMHHLYTDRMQIHLKANGLEKKDLMILDILATNQWQRPVYFNNTSLITSDLDFQANILQEGMVYRLLPIVNPDPTEELVNSKVMYPLMMDTLQWRNLNHPDVYYSTEDHVYRGINLYRQNFNALIKTLLEEGKEDQAQQALNKCLSAMPSDVVPFDFSSVALVRYLFMLKDDQQAMQMSDRLHKQAKASLEYYIGEGKHNRMEISRNMVLLQSLANILKEYHPESAELVVQDFMRYYELLS